MENDDEEITKKKLKTTHWMIETRDSLANMLEMGANKWNKTIRSTIEWAMAMANIILFSYFNSCVRIPFHFGEKFN